MSNPVLDAPAAQRERLARVALGELFEPGHKRIDTLMPGMTAFELFRRLYEAGGDQELREAREDIRLRMDALRPERTLELADKLGLRFVTPYDDEWPSSLDALAGAPPIQDRTGVPFGLWVKGPVRLDTLERSVAIVGSRDATSYGAAMAGRIAAGVAGRAAVVSGAAIGVDAAAHRGALAVGGRTVAVLACGADVAYPRCHERLLATIAESGAVVSEIPPGLRVTRMRFLGRNRLIAALARGTVVTEAALRSGALNTANWATSLNRQLMGVPGPVTSVTSAGVHEQIRQGRASLVTGPADVLELISRPGECLVEPRRAPETRRDRLSTTHRQVLDAVPVGAAATAESISRAAGIALPTVGSAMSHLSEAGLVRRTPQGWLLAPGAAGR